MKEKGLEGKVGRGQKRAIDYMCHVNRKESPGPRKETNRGGQMDKKESQQKYNMFEIIIGKLTTFNAKSKK